MNHDYTPKWNEKFDEDNDEAEPSPATPSGDRTTEVQSWMSESLLSPIIENKEESEVTEKSTGKKKKRFLRLFKRSFSDIATTEAEPKPIFIESLAMSSKKGPEPQSVGAEVTSEMHRTDTPQVTELSGHDQESEPDIQPNDTRLQDLPEFPPPLPETQAGARRQAQANYEPAMINTPYQMARAETFAATDPDLLVPEQSMIHKKTTVSAAGAFFAAEFLSKRRDKKLEKETKKLKKQLAKQQHQLEKQKSRHTDLVKNVNEYQTPKPKPEQKINMPAKPVHENAPGSSKETFFVPPVLKAPSAEQYSSSPDRKPSHVAETSLEKTTIIHESEQPKTPETVDLKQDTHPFYLLDNKDKKEQERKKKEQYPNDQVQETRPDTRRDADFDRRHEILDDSTKVVSPSVAASGSRFVGRAPVPIASVLKDRERVQSRQAPNRSSQTDEHYPITQPQTSMYKQSVQYGIGTALGLFAFVIAVSTLL